MKAATKNDWPDLHPMPTSYEDLKIALHFNSHLCPWHEPAGYGHSGSL